MYNFQNAFSYANQILLWCCFVYAVCTLVQSFVTDIQTDIHPDFDL